METHLTIEGMSCDGCRTSVSSALGRVSGVERVEVNLENARGVVWHDDVVPVETLLKAVDDAGFRAKVASTGRG